MKSGLRSVLGLPCKPDNIGRDQKCSSSTVQSSEAQVLPGAAPGNSLSHRVGTGKMEEGKLWLQRDVGMPLPTPARSDIRSSIAGVGPSSQPGLFGNQEGK